MNDEFFTPTEVAEKLKVTKQAVYKWMKDGRLKYVIVGSERRVMGSAIMDFIRAGTEAEQENVQKNETPGLVPAYAV